MKGRNLREKITRNHPTKMCCPGISRVIWMFCFRRHDLRMMMMMMMTMMMMMFRSTQPCKCFHMGQWLNHTTGKKRKKRLNMQPILPPHHPPQKKQRKSSFADTLKSLINSSYSIQLVYIINHINHVYIHINKLLEVYVCNTPMTSNYTSNICISNRKPYISMTSPPSKNRHFARHSEEACSNSCGAIGRRRAGPGLRG